MTRNDVNLAYGMTFAVDPVLHAFDRVPRSDDLCSVCGRGEFEVEHARVARSKSEYKRLKVQGADVVPPSWAAVKGQP